MGFNWVFKGLMHFYVCTVVFRNISTVYKKSFVFFAPDKICDRGRYVPKAGFVLYVV
jgi:hypothetical protein